MTKDKDNIAFLLNFAIMRKVVIILISIVFCIECYSQDYYSYVDSSDKYIESQDWIKAEEFILKALKSEPANYNNSLLLSNLATIQRMQGRNDEAINNYSIALNITPNAVTLLNNRGALYLEMDSINLALSDFERVMDLDPNDIDSRYYYGLIMLEKDKLGESKMAFDRIKKINPNSLEWKIGMAFLAKKQKNYFEAIRLFSQLIKEEIRAEWLMHRGECYMAENLYVDAANDINDALHIDPTNGYLYMLKAKLNKKQFQEGDFLKNLELAVKHGIDKDFAIEWINRD